MLDSERLKQAWRYEGAKMPRKPRFFLPGVPAHVVQRGNNRQAVFYDEADYRAYLGWLEELYPLNRDYR